MKKHNLLAGLVVLSIYGYGCGDKATAEKDGKADSSAAASSTADKKDAKNDGKKDEKATEKKDDAAKKPDAAIGSGPGSAPSAGGGGALKHLSDECQVAVHLDVAQFVNYPAVQKELVPTLDEMLATASPKDKDFEKFQAAVKDLGFDYKKVQDVAVCVTNVQDAEHTFAVIVAAGIKSDALIPQIEKLDEKKKATFEDVDGHKVAMMDKVAVGQAADGVVIIAGSKDIFKKISGATGMSSASLDGAKFLAFGVRPQAVQMFTALMEAKSKKKDDKAEKAMEPLKHIKEVTGFQDIASGKTEFVAECDSADDAKGVEALVTLMKNEFAGKIPDPKAAEALKALQSHTDGSKVVVDFTTPKETYDQSIKQLGEILKAQKGKM